MVRLLLKVLLIVVILAVILMVVFFFLARKEIPSRITYGMSFNTMYAEELGLPWKEVYDAFLDELGVRHLRLAAHWPMVEPTKDTYDFTALDYQLDRAEEAGADVVFAVGKRLPRWPECHVPTWAKDMSWDSQKEEIREYIEAVVTRYKDRSSIIYWQVENEPYLEVFAREHCDPLDEVFFEEEIELVRSLDGTRPILVTDSGNLGTWKGAYTHGDAFGTSVYVYFWNPELGQFKTILPPSFYRAKDRVMRILFGSKETMLIELSAEPWLVEPVIDVDIPTQFTRMNEEKFAEIIEYARHTRYDRQYLWGGEWWYWLATKGYPEMWDAGKSVFQGEE